MPIMCRTGGAYKAPKAVLLRTGGVYKAPKALFRRVNGIYVKVWESIVALSASITGAMYGDATSFNGRAVNLIGAATATPSGGTAPYTYQWSISLDQGTSPSLTDATTATVTLRVTGATTRAYVGRAVCQIKDAAGQTVTVSTPYTFYIEGSRDGGLIFE